MGMTKDISRAGDMRGVDVSVQRPSHEAIVKPTPSSGRFEASASMQTLFAVACHPHRRRRVASEQFRPVSKPKNLGQSGGRPLAFRLLTGSRSSCNHDYGTAENEVRPFGAADLTQHSVHIRNVVIRHYLMLDELDETNHGGSPRGILGPSKVSLALAAAMVCGAMRCMGRCQTQFLRHALQSSSCHEDKRASLR